MLNNNNLICYFLVVIKFLLLIYLLGGLVNHVGCLSFSYLTFSEDCSSNFVFTGSSGVSLEGLHVTLPVPYGYFNVSKTGDFNVNKTGRVWYKQPFKLWNRKNNFTASFNSTFIFNFYPITQPNGEGLAFILTGDTSLPDSSEGQWLGIVNASTDGSAAAQIVAVEFDTRKSYSEDVDDNHVGLDVNSINSIEQFSLSNLGINLSSGTAVKVQIEYDGRSEMIKIFVANRFSSVPAISSPLKISEYLPGSIYVGFSASTGYFTQLNTVVSWQFIIDDMEEVQEDNSTNLLWHWVTIPVAIILLCGFTCFLYRKRQLANDQRKDAVRTIEEKIGGFNMAAPCKFQLKALKYATKNFHSKNKLGEGGFGTVYRGFLEEVNMEVAIKRVSKDSRQGKQEFLAEVTTISRLRHKNLVKLLGWCYDNDELLLVYDFMPNGSLDKLLFYEDSPCMEEPILSWERRQKIIGGVANVLDYLHNGCEKRVLHRDVKSSNVMLDSEFNARLGDFGLARIIQNDGKTHHTTIGIAGTPGYMAPECYLLGRVSVEMDVYGFGIFVLEVVCGRRPGNDNHRNNLNMNILDWVWELFGGERILDAVDPRLQGHFDVEESDCLLKLGLACCHPNPNQRPTMRVALQVITGEAAPPVLPKIKPAFVWPAIGDPEYSLNGGQLTPSTVLSGR